MFITRRLEFDAGHRIPDHKSQCRHLHGHRYALEITLGGNIIHQDGNAANGMVMDFSEVKALARRHLVELWDHAFLVYAGDAPVVEYLEAEPEVLRMRDDIARFITSWLPCYERDNRSYLTVGIGCTGGQHRSVYFTEWLGQHFSARARVIVRHRELSPKPNGQS